MDLWQQFWNSGSVEDYLAYKNSQPTADAEVKDANDDQGHYNQRTDNWGE